MKRTPCLLALTVPWVLALALAAAPAHASGVRIQRMHIEPGVLSARLVLEADAALLVRQAYYAPRLPHTLIIDVDQVQAAEAPAIPAAEARFIEDVRVLPAGAESLRLEIRLREKVPYRIFADRGQTVVELNKIQRGGADYVIDESVRSRLEAKSPAVVSLHRLDVREAPGRVEVRARLTEDAVAQVFALESPPRLIVDVFDTLFTPGAAVYDINRLGIRKVRAAQFRDSEPRPITRLVFDLEAPGSYALDSEGNELVVSFSEAAEPGPAAAETAPKPAAAVPPAIMPPPPQPEPAKAEPVKIEPKPEAVKTPPVDAAAGEKPASPPGTQAAAPPSAAERQVAAGQEDQFKPKVIQAVVEEYSGEVISCKFKDADLRDVMLYLADIAGLNLVFDPEVRGNVTCNFQDVPWDQVMDILLKNNKMGKTIEGNVLRIAPMTTLTREDEEQQKFRESKENAGPLVTKTITLSYSKARDVSTLLTTKRSDRGEIVIDDRTNTLIVTDVREKMDFLEKLIGVLDTATPQVSIEARIVEATSTFIRNLGIQWGARGIVDPFYGNATSVEFPNKILVDGAMIPQGQVTKGIGGPLGGYAVNLPAPAFNTAVGFSFANVLDTFRLDVALSALETSGDGKIISSPKITTQNNQPAEIIQGRQIPVQTVANFTVTTRYINAALELHATPQITAEGTIIMYVEIKNDAADFANLVNGIPPITTQSAKTTLMIPDGGTTVIGGIYRTEDSITRDRVPFLHSIPILGNLFRSFARTKQNRELLIFITPRIVK